jgi:hypothetical protein
MFIIQHMPFGTQLPPAQVPLEHTHPSGAFAVPHVEQSFTTLQGVYPHEWQHVALASQVPGIIPTVQAVPLGSGVNVQTFPTHVPGLTKHTGAWSHLFPQGDPVDDAAVLAAAVLAALELAIPVPPPVPAVPLDAWLAVVPAPPDPGMGAPMPRMESHPASAAAARARTTSHERLRSSPWRRTSPRRGDRTKPPAPPAAADP